MDAWHLQSWDDYREVKRLDRNMWLSEGKMISIEDRTLAATLINETIEAGSAVSKACREAGIDRRTYRRWTAAGEGAVLADSRPEAARAQPSNKLSDEERSRVLDACHEARFADTPPARSRLRWLTKAHT